MMYITKFNQFTKKYDVIFNNLTVKSFNSLIDANEFAQVMNDEYFA